MYNKANSDCACGCLIVVMGEERALLCEQIFYEEELQAFLIEALRNNGM